MKRTRGKTSGYDPNTGEFSTNVACAMIVLDGQIIYYGVEDDGFGKNLIMDLRLNEIESVRWLSKMEAALRFGMMGEAGALVVTTRLGKDSPVRSGFTGRTRPPGRN